MSLSPLAARKGEGRTHEALAHFTGGMTVPLSSPRYGGMEGDDFGMKAGGTYVYNFDDRWAVMTGLEFANYSGRITYKKLTDSYSTTDDRVTPSNAVTYSYSISNYRETQTLSLLSLPLMLRMKTDLDTRTSLYFAAGGKVALPMLAQAKMSGKLTSSANFDHENVVYSNLPGHDFFDGETFGAQGKKIETKTAVILSLESGLRFAIGRIMLYAALNFDCSLNNIKGASEKHPLNFAETGLYCESLLNTTFTERLKINSFGLKLGFGFF
ncbi:MAG: outer membrane beta-barrel protein [Prevotellaceae bacterium]|nr:outer membrane beta-barrel protein [Prevotellaceae bacterium]